MIEMQENYDQLEGLNAQEGAKVKHMVSPFLLPCFLFYLFILFTAMGEAQGH